MLGRTLGLFDVFPVLVGGTTDPWALCYLVVREIDYGNWFATHTGKTRQCVKYASVSTVNPRQNMHSHPKTLIEMWIILPGPGFG